MHPQNTTTLGVVNVPLFSRWGQLKGYTWVDTADAPQVTGIVWRLNGRGYAIHHITLDGSEHRIYMHRLLLSLPIVYDGREGDHRNRDRLDNRRSNLRVVTHAANLQNKSSQRGSTSQHRGVYWDRHNQRWRAYVWTQGHRHWLGSFTDEAPAAEAARRARLRLMPHAVD